MDGTSISVGPVFFAALAALAVLGAGVVGWARRGPGRAVLSASARAAVQLAAVSAIIVVVLRSWWSAAAFIVVMYVAAAFTFARRISPRRTGWVTVLPIGLGVVRSRAGPALRVSEHE